MRTNGLLFLVIVTVLISCKKDDNALTTLKGRNGVPYKESLAIWNELKKNNGNSYQYITSMGSWTGYGSETTLKVENGVVTSRVYTAFKIDGSNGQKEILDTYTETIAELGSHNKGAAPLTIDDLYNSCAGEYLKVDRENNTLYFEAELDGVMTLCGFVPNGCMDDCFRGVRINSFTWIE
jgi:hypothetical protein